MASPIVPKPPWLKIRPPTTERYAWLRETMEKTKLKTVCQEAHCPNMSECWSSGTASFLVLGDTCTRGCRFCATQTAAKGKELDPMEPLKLARTVQEMKLNYVVITSVDRDDLPDFGAGHFADCVKAVKRLSPKTKIEVLTPDFGGEKKHIKAVLDAWPDVFGHNLETVRRLQNNVRDQRASYERSLLVLKTAKKTEPTIFSKSALMLGMGEKKEEVLQAMDDLRKAGVELLSIGQYLQPSPTHFPLNRFVSPAEFSEFRQAALDKGFLSCQSGPFVRSSYKAGKFFLPKR